jgi:iron complex outermembrane receptor protein
VSGRQDLWQWKIGGDVYQLQQNATRTILRRSNDVQLFQDAVWPDATLTNGGLYGQLVYEEGAMRIGGTVRVDMFSASADGASAYFLENTDGALSTDDTLVSAAVNANFLVQGGWTLTLGAGRAVRAPDALERYADRFPAAQFQTAAEFVGNPGLRPERSSEVNAGSTFSVGRAIVQGDVFFRVIDDYITVSPDSTLTRRLPLSPTQVFRYVNGTSARFAGYELKAQSPAGPYADLSAGWSYLWAEDELFGEPVFGITPFEQRYAVEVHTAGGGRWVELAVTSAARQERVAVTRLERPTDGWTRLDLRAGVAVGQGVTVRAGIENLADAAYATHLNTLNPFTGDRIREMGRRGYLGLEYAF